MDGEGSSFDGGSIRDTCSGSSPVFGRVLFGVGRSPARSTRVRDVVGPGKVAAHQSSRDEGAVLLSRCGQVLGTEWSLHPQVARLLLRVWGNPSNYLFATRLNVKLSLYCSLVPDLQAVFEDAFPHPRDDLDLYAFPPFPLMGQVIARVRESSRVAMTLVAPLWPEKEWFADLLLLLTQPPLALPWWDSLLRQPHCSLFHQGVRALNRHTWRHSSVTSESRVFREGLLEFC